MASPTDILNWRRFNGRITTSGQPSEAQLAALADLGVRHIINLGPHTHARALSDEAGAVASLGMNYVYIPVAFDRPTEEDFAGFCAALRATGDEPAHVHCIVNARVTAFLYRYQRDVLGEDEASARLLLESVWRPGGAWAAFLGDQASAAADHQYAGRDYEAPGPA